MTQKVLDENKLVEILELAKIGEQQLKEISEMATAMADKYQGMKRE
ncbi:hypothetical protein [Argonema antarcticum]|nr:hypothetical protein [Argonema antarcticum]MCL1470118.1 hypothetical protein [Argonema antarcticum A004/B2]